MTRAGLNKSITEETFANRDIFEESNNSLLSRSPKWFGYAVVVALEAALTVLLAVLMPVFPIGHYPISYVILTMAIAYLLSEGPAIVSIVLGWLLFTYFFVQPPGISWPLSHSIEGWAQQVALILGVIVVGAAMIQSRRSNKRIRRLAEDSMSLNECLKDEVGEREQAENALRESEGRLRATFDNAALGIIEVDFNSSIITVNQRICRMLGYTREEMLGMKIHDLTYPEDRPLSGQLNAEVNSGQRDIADYRKRYIKRDGSPLWVHVTVSAIRDTNGRFLRAVGTVEDISDVKRAEEREKELEARQFEFYRRTILAATNGKLCITDRKDIEEIAGKPVASWEVTDTAGLAKLRLDVIDIAQSFSMNRDGVNKLITCVGEAATNALKHAGKGTASLHRKAETLLVKISDTGPGIQELSLPDVALVMGYSTVGTGGMGYKLMIKSADKIYLATGPEGTTVAAELEIR